jgi:glutathione S-transferase
MPDIILHHYASSPFSELLRIALGHKGLAWHSVTIPVMAPKPDLVPLTGGYRKTPVLQIGADIYCDTAIAIEALERIKPTPSLFPAPLGRAAIFAAMWAAGPLFLPSVASAMSGATSNLPQAFWDDRKALFGMDPERMTLAAPHLRAQFAISLARLEDSLSDGRAFFAGSEAGYADFALYMNVWFQRLFIPDAPVLAPFAKVKEWADRVAAIGHGTPVEMSAADALAVAKGATPSVETSIDEGSGFVAGQPVTVRTEDPGANPVAGTLARLTARDIAVLRDDPQVGTVAVHFPRLGQIVAPA